MSEEEKRYCNWCDTNNPQSWITVYDLGRLVWCGCANCYTKKKELENNAIKK